VIYYNAIPSEKWIIRKSNIGMNHMTGLANFRDDITGISRDKEWVNRLNKKANKNEEEHWIPKSRILETDRFRNLNIEEYMMLSNILKKFRYKYNKKKDEFIKIIADEY
jgi:hypothetical protein